jgi:hypothetical protein
MREEAREETNARGTRISIHLRIHSPGMKKKNQNEKKTGIERYISSGVALKRKTRKSEKH